MSVSATGEIKQNKTVSAPAMEIQAEIRNKNSNSSEPCAKEFDLKINMSLPCPEVDFTGSLAIDRTVTVPKLEIVTSEKYPDTDQCGKVVQINMSLPCPDVDFAGSLALNKTVLTPKLEVTTTEKYPGTDQCGQVVDFNVSLPCNDTEFTGELTLDKSVLTPRLDITATDKYPDTDQCGQVIDFGVSLPCPEVDLAGHGQAIQARNITTPKLNITETPKYPLTDQCGENVSLGLSLPCPDFDVTGQLTVLGAGATPTLEVEQTNKYPATQQCGSVINFKFNIPKATAWCSGNGPPTVETCGDGDYYLDLGNGNVYIKSNGSWTGPVTNLKGQDGSNGSNGSNGSDGKDCVPQDCPRVSNVTCTANMLVVTYKISCETGEEPGVTGNCPQGTPVGSIIMWAKEPIPDGWLECNGGTFDATQYPALFDLYGNNKLPDLRSAFVRGRGQNAGALNAFSTSNYPYKTAAPANSFTLSTAAEHTHSNAPGAAINAGGGGTDLSGYDNTGTTGAGGAHTHTITGGGDTETVPEHRVLIYIVKGIG